MTVVSMKQLTDDMQLASGKLIDQPGFFPQAVNRPLEAADLLFYISETSMHMAAYLHQHGLFFDSAGLHFDVEQFSVIEELAFKVITEREAGKMEGVWQQLDLSTDEDMDNNGTYVLIALRALDLLYGPSQETG